MIRLSQLKALYFIPAVLVIGMGAFMTWFGSRPVDQVETTKDSQVGLAEGRNYYVFVRSLEVAAKKPSGAAWDRGGAAPDLFYEVRWRDNLIFSSSTQRDQLIANWSPLGVDAIDAIREGRISIDSVIHAAAIRASQMETFQIDVYDSDPVSNDVIATMTFNVSELKEGDNTFTYQQSEEHSVTHLRLALVNADLALVGQIEQIMNPSS